MFTKLFIHILMKRPDIETVINQCNIGTTHRMAMRNINLEVQRKKFWLFHVYVLPAFF